jgi:hypothetical protein
MQPVEADEVCDADILWCSRDSAFTDFAAWLEHSEVRALWRPLWHRLRLLESPNSLGSGVEREWLDLAARQLCRLPSLLAPSADGGRSLAPAADPLSEHQLASLSALGSLLGYMLVNERTWPLPLEPPFLRALLGRASSLTLDDLESVDHALCKSLQAVLDADDVDSLGLTWSADLCGAELGTGEAVTEENKLTFVNAVAAFRMHGRCAGGAAAVRRGLLRVIPREWLSMLTEQDLTLLFGGASDVDVADLRAHTLLEGFAPSDPLVAWFWRCVEAMTAEERSMLLRLATGAGAAPVGGFAELLGLHGKHPFTLLRSSAATTCLPTAVRFGSGGFEFV